MQTFLKWTGSKRLYGDFIVNKFPREAEIYYEPFLGSGSILLYLLSSDIKVSHYIVSDICEPLILLWKQVQKNPQILIEDYDKFRKEFVKNKKQVFNEIREEFNKDKTKENLFVKFQFLIKKYIILREACLRS